MSILFRDPVTLAVELALRALAQGERSPEHEKLDFKEEAGRRDAQGDLLPGESKSDSVAKQLAHEAACFANSGGGALIVGVRDDGQLIGATTDAEWLRMRIYHLTDSKLIVTVTEQTICEARLLVVSCPAALEPIRYRGKISWRVNDRCVEVDAASWHANLMVRRGYDWSAAESTVPAERVRPEALAVARQFLRDSGELHGQDLAAAPDMELLRRLNVVSPDGLLTNAGVLAFVGRGNPAVDYVRRDAPGGDSVQRLRPRDVSVLEELSTVVSHIRIHGRRQHLRGALAQGQVEQLPVEVAREAVVNGIVHRDWAAPEATLVEHVGATLTVSSPGGFVGGVTPTNIITHPSAPRYRSLAELMAALRIAEREGIGVDRMMSGMLRLGHPLPEIAEIEGPYVRVALVAGDVDEAWMDWLRSIRPQPPQDLQVLLCLKHLAEYGWIDARLGQGVLQVSEIEAYSALRRTERCTLRGGSVVEVVKGVPGENPPAWTLTRSARSALQQAGERRGWRAQAPEITPRSAALHWAASRGRVSTPELASILGASPTNVSRHLRELEAEGLLRPSRPSRSGRGFFYYYNADSLS